MEEDKAKELRELLKQQEQLQERHQQMVKLLEEFKENKIKYIWRRNKPIRALSYLIMFMLLVLIATIIYFYAQF